MEVEEAEVEVVMEKEKLENHERKLIGGYLLNRTATVPAKRVNRYLSIVWPI